MNITPEKNKERVLSGAKTAGHHLLLNIKTDKFERISLFHDMALRIRN